MGTVGQEAFRFDFRTLKPQASGGLAGCRGDHYAAIIRDFLKG
jgi:hypothetical protein